VLVEGLLTNEAAGAIFEGALEKFDAFVCLAKVSSEVVFSRIVLVASGFGTRVALPLGGVEMNEVVPFQVAGSFERFVAAFELASEFAVLHITRALTTGDIVFIIYMGIGIVTSTAGTLCNGSGIWFVN
jgi:hypothetical protein